MIQRVEEFGLKAHVIYGTERTVIAAIGEKRDEHRQSLESGPGVAEVVPILAPYKVASIEVKPERTVVRVGPSRSSATATSASSPGPARWRARSRRWPPPGRSRPPAPPPCAAGPSSRAPAPTASRDSRKKGLKILAAARAETGLPVVTEVLAAADVDLVARYADVLQIGARNMQNYRLLGRGRRDGQAGAAEARPSATMEELLLAAEYILNAGNQNVMLCERGIRTFETHTRFTLPLATVPYLHERTHLPVIVDPSHGTGHTSLVPRMAAAAVAAGADGLMLEVHPDPGEGPERRLPVARLSSSSPRRWSYAAAWPTPWAR